MTKLSFDEWFRLVKIADAAMLQDAPKEIWYMPYWQYAYDHDYRDPVMAVYVNRNGAFSKAAVARGYSAIGS